MVKLLKKFAGGVSDISGDMVVNFAGGVSKFGGKSDL